VSLSTESVTSAVAASFRMADRFIAICS
jgi:hypothetical protein